MIALIITIIVLLILAGVSISMVVDDNGIVSQAVNASTATDVADTKEQIQLAIIGYLDENGEYTEDDVLSAVQDVLGSDASIDEETEGVYTVTTAKENIVDISDIMASANEVIKLTATDIAEMEDKTEIYGAIVNNYQVDLEATNQNGDSLQESLDSQNIEWKIFYAGTVGNETTNYIYLIASNYVLTIDSPKTSSGYSAVYDDEDYRIDFEDVVKDYKGTESISDTVKALNSTYSSTTSTWGNAKASAYLLDINIWSMYAGEYARYAIGGPSIELWCKSWNDKGYTALYYDKVNSYGYYIGDSSSPGTTMLNIKSLTNSGYKDSLYILDSDDVNGYFLASPSACNYYTLNLIYNSQWIFYYGYYYGSYYSSSGVIGYRPIICLSADVELKQISSTEYSIVEN